MWEDFSRVKIEVSGKTESEIGGESDNVKWMVKMNDEKVWNWNEQGGDLVSSVVWNSPSSWEHDRNKEMVWILKKEEKKNLKVRLNLTSEESDKPEAVKKPVMVEPGSDINANWIKLNTRKPQIGVGVGVNKPQIGVGIKPWMRVGVNPTLNAPWAWSPSGGVVKVGGGIKPWIKMGINPTATSSAIWVAKDVEWEKAEEAKKAEEEAQRR